MCSRANIHIHIHSAKPLRHSCLVAPSHPNPGLSLLQNACDAHRAAERLELAMRRMVVHAAAAAEEVRLELSNDTETIARMVR